MGNGVHGEGQELMDIRRWEQISTVCVIMRKLGFGGETAVFIAMTCIVGSIDE